MSDIAERLRRLEAVTMPSQPFTLATARPWLKENYKLRLEAADTIEALQAELERLYGKLYYIRENGDAASQAIARAALTDPQETKT